MYVSMNLEQARRVADAVYVRTLVLLALQEVERLPLEDKDEEGRPLSREAMLDRLIERRGMKKGVEVIASFWTTAARVLLEEDERLETARAGQTNEMVPAAFLDAMMAPKPGGSPSG